MAPPKATTKKWIDKKSAQTFQLLYRSQADPLINDEEASDFVFAQVEAPNTKPGNATTNPNVKTMKDLQEELGDELKNRRKNEGEASLYGIYYDDTKYDYMQHMREMGGSTTAVFIDAPAVDKQKGKKNKKTLDMALKDEELEPKSTVIRIPKEMMQSENLVKKTYQDQQDIPDAIAGFQPDMDPRIREVLEALEDEEYVDNDEDLFNELAQAGEADEDDFFDQEFEEEDDGWASDATEKPTQPAHVASSSKEKESEEPQGDEWMKEFSKFKKAQKKQRFAEDDDASSFADTMSFGGSSAFTAGSISVSGRRRRRREKKAGAATASSGYSMSSSALFRTEGLTLLDDRFDKIEEEYNMDDEEDEKDGIVPETRKDFDSIMDEFLEGYTMTGQRPSTHRVKRGKNQSGLDQLDEIRRTLGNTKIRA
ncbi:Low temperature viability protein [Pyronema omphalodes]|nr:Low temperature viability protein [Pyronema omphalodes]